MPTTRAAEATQLAAELSKHLGNGPLTARELAAELLALDAAPDLLAAFEDALSRAAATDEDDELDDTLWGLPPTERELAVASRRAQAAVDDALSAALADALSREAVALRLGISPQAVSKRLAAGSVVALRRGRERRFPAWQFHEDGLLPGLRRVIEVYGGTALSLTVWATSPSADLGGRAPAEVLAERDGVERVLEAARALTPAAW